MRELIVQGVFMYDNSIDYWINNKLEDLENGHYFGNRVHQGMFSYTLAVF